MGNIAEMNPQDAVFGGLAECYVTIDGRRYNFMTMTEFESKWEVNIADVPILGKVGMGHKAAGHGAARPIITSRCSVRWQTSTRRPASCRILRSR